MQDFRQLLVWQRAHRLCLDVREAVSRFPRQGYTDLKSQIRRSAESIPSNIVEGCAAASRREFAHFLDISIKSTSELEYQLQLARDYDILDHERWKQFTGEVAEIRKMLTALRRAVLEAADRQPKPRPSRPRRDAAMPAQRQPSNPKDTGGQPDTHASNPEDRRGQTDTQASNPEDTGTDDR